jgi:hypothetical protein
MSGGFGTQPFMSTVTSRPISPRATRGTTPEVMQ